MYRAPDRDYYANEGDRQAAEEYAKDARKGHPGIFDPTPLTLGGPHALTAVDEPMRSADDGRAFAAAQRADRMLD